MAPRVEEGGAGGEQRVWSRLDVSGKFAEGGHGDSNVLRDKRGQT